MVFSTVFPQAHRIAPAAVIAAARSKRFIEAPFYLLIFLDIQTVLENV
jgi:hypothetical protein